MFDIQNQAENHLEQLLTRIYQRLAQQSMMSEQSRDLTPIQQSLMSELEENGFLYQSLIKILAIDSYTFSITSHLDKYNTMLRTLPSILQKMEKFGEMLKDTERRKLLENYQSIFDQLFDCFHACEQNSQSVQSSKKILQASQTEIDDGLVIKLKEENAQLKRKLKNNDAQLISMEIKLTQLLKQHDHPQENGPNYLQLRQELAFKESQIERMNQEFSYEIEKYNTVYEAMKKELEEMRGYQNVDLIEQIELLETEIVRLRQENERDQMIIRQLRADHMMMSGVGQFEHSRHPRHYSKYNY